MRISDWSSDVCSSDLRDGDVRAGTCNREGRGGTDAAFRSRTGFHGGLSPDGERVVTLGPAQWILVIVALQRLGELLLARRNTARLKAEGGYELGAGHYPIIVGVHAALLVVMFLAVDRGTPILWAPFVLFLLLDRKSTRLNSSH